MAASRGARPVQMMGCHLGSDDGLSPNPHHELGALTRIQRRPPLRGAVHLLHVFNACGHLNAVTACAQQARTCTPPPMSFSPSPWTCFLPALQHQSGINPAQRRC
eukprot:365377-Chlamydomonas_euryale.AAC.23